MRRVLWMAALLLLTISPRGRAEQSLEVGFVEDAAPAGQSSGPRLRVGFRHTDSSWEPVTKLLRSDTPSSFHARATQNAARRWTVCARGKVLTTGTTTPFKDIPGWTDVGEAALSLKDKATWIGVAGAELSGLYASSGHHPFLATTGRSCANPDRWTPGLTGPHDKALLKNAFMRTTQGLKVCQKDGTQVLFVAELNSFQVEQSFVAGDGRKILVVAPVLKAPGLMLCRDRPHTSYLRVFLIDKSGGIRVLPPSFRVVDAVDLDGDGHSEIIGWQNDGHEEGYVILSDGLTRSASFVWPLNDDVMKKLRD